MKKVIIVAKSDNNVIGVNGGLPWHMPADLAFFHRQIEGCYLLSGRRSFESDQGREIFNGRPFVIVTRQKDYHLADGKVAHTLEEGISTAEASGAGRLCILGGGEIYHQAIGLADEIVATEVHTRIENGAAFFPEISPRHWEEYRREDHSRDAENPYDYSFVFYKRAGTTP